MLTKLAREGNTANDGYLLLHVWLLSSSERNWSFYIEHLRSTLQDFVSLHSTSLDRSGLRGQEDKACFSSIGIPVPYDYNLAFSDYQQLHLLLKKFLRASSAFESIVEVIGGFKTLCQELQSAKSQPPMGLNLLSVQLQSHRRNVSKLVQYLRGTADIVRPSSPIVLVDYADVRQLSKGLEFRNHERSQESLTVLRTLAFEIQREQASLSQLAAQAQRDSKAIKALTFIATMYLPASFIAVGYLRPVSAN